MKKMQKAFQRLNDMQPDGHARADAIRLAMARYKEINSQMSQGMADQDRLKVRGNPILNLFKWRRLMTLIQPKLTHMLAGGVSLAALAMVVNINYFQTGNFELPTKKIETLTVPSLDAIQPKGEEVTVNEFRDDSRIKSDEVFSREAAPKSMVAKQRRLQQVAGGLVASKAISPQPLLRNNDVVVRHYQDQGRDKFSDIRPNPVKVVKEDPVSTFSVDVDTASYSFVRAALNRSVLPQKDAVRIEELINYFDYDYAVPDGRAEPFTVSATVMPTPWNSKTRLLRIGIKGYDLPKSQAPKSNLVFLIDTSGSMNSPDKLPLLRNSFKLLLSSLKPDDTVSIVTYAGSAGTVLEPTKVTDKHKILSALDRLASGGSTAGGEGIRQAYQLAERNAQKGGVNRVILATDGDFNVGITDVEELKSFVERKRETGITLSVLGFGHGNYNDELMQTLAQNGNGNAAYIDTLSEARKVLVEQAGATLFTIAKDVKLQLEFNPALVSEYRLIGYETRLLNREDFNNDKIDAGDIGAGHTVTALYEMTLAGSGGRLIDDLRYGKDDTAYANESSDEYAFMKIRYKLPDSDTSTLITTAISISDEAETMAKAPQDARFAAAVAGFGQLLRGGRYTSDYRYDDVITLASSAKGEDRFGYRAEFINLVRLAKSAAALEPQEQ